MEFKLDLMQMMSFNTVLELVLCTQNVCTFGSDYKNQNQNHFSIFGMWAFYVTIFSATAEKKSFYKITMRMEFNSVGSTHAHQKCTKYTKE